MAHDWRTPFFAALRSSAAEREEDVITLPLLFGNKHAVPVEVILVEDELRVRVTDAHVETLDDMLATGMAQRFREGVYRNSWLNAVEKVRSGLGSSVSFNAFATALLVPQAYPKRTSPTINVYRTARIRTDSLPALLSEDLVAAAPAAAGKGDTLLLAELGEALFPPPEEGPVGGSGEAGGAEDGGQPATAPAASTASPPLDEEEVWADHHNVIFFGPPGTGKSYRLNAIARAHLGVAHERLLRVTFHPETSYFDFIGSFRPAVGWRRVANEFTDPDGKRTHEEPLTFYRFEPGPLSEALRLAEQSPGEKVVLAIEELNRGNVAAVFGDVFQLLDRRRSSDRSKDGWSEYGIRPSTEWSQWLRRVCTNGHVFREGRLYLPPNLYLYATMNTSDQSLFPMDTAFRRRWGLQYVGLGDRGNHARVPLHGGDSVGVPWLTLMDHLNRCIVEHTRTDDKQMGPWFVRARPKRDLVDGVQFRSKVLFYLWSEVFRDRPERVFRPGIATYDELVAAYKSGQNVLSDELLTAVGAL